MENTPIEINIEKWKKIGASVIKNFGNLNIIDFKVRLLETINESREKGNYEPWKELPLSDTDLYEVYSQSEKYWKELKLAHKKLIENEKSEHNLKQNAIEKEKVEKSNKKESTFSDEVDKNEAVESKLKELGYPKDEIDKMSKGEAIDTAYKNKKFTKKSVAKEKGMGGTVSKDLLSDLMEKTKYSFIKKIVPVLFSYTTLAILILVGMCVFSFLIYKPIPLNNENEKNFTINDIDINLRYVGHSMSYNMKGSIRDFNKEKMDFLFLSDQDFLITLLKMDKRKLNFNSEYKLYGTIELSKEQFKEISKVKIEY